ncbi:MAG: hypothetical protein HOO99_18645 [Hyphomicrobiaceae bacterium]|nr:hypothetical protein [Hyphomicrobiaceae bacterium]
MANRTTSLIKAARQTSTARALVAFVAVLVMLALGASSSRQATALDVDFSGRQVKRKLLALYDSKHEPGVHTTRLHKLAEMPLNHLGFIVDYHDVNAPLPVPTDLASYRGIITWFVEPLVDPARYVAWLERALSPEMKYVMLGEVAPREADELIPAINRILGRFGLGHGGNFHDITYKAKVVTRDADMIGFERKLDKVLPGFPVIDAKSNEATHHMVVEIPYEAGPRRSVVVATSENGGFAAQNYTVVLEPNTDRLSWLLNPFAFFRKSLGADRFPIPDVTTVSGRRIYFSHIDGDGWNNLSTVESYRNQQVLSAEVVAREAIAPYPDLPVSVALLAGDIQPLLGGNPAGAPIARRLFALPQVEVASHTHTHPYNWGFYESYSRAAEDKLIAGYRPPDQPMREKVTEQLMRVAGKEFRSGRYDRYVAGSDELPRTYLRRDFDLELEVGGALKVSENFAPAGKKAKLYQWSGDTTPFEGAIAATRRAGVRNLNGGDSRLDEEFPSVAYVPPLSRVAGKERQIYAVNSNENTYTNDWTGPFGGQMMLEHTLKNTETPRRLKGFNLYYHMYSGEKTASLAAIKYFLNMARTTDVTPIAASHYAAMADDYFTTTIAQTGLFSWSVRNRGALETVRFDVADSVEVDHAVSKGVLGANRHQGSIYLSLDPAVTDVSITLRPRVSGTATQAVASTEPLVTLVHSRWRFSNWQHGECSETTRAEGFGMGEIQFATRPGRGLRVIVSRHGKTLAEEIRWANAEGQLSLRLSIDAIEPIDIRLQCHE